MADGDLARFPVIDTSGDACCSHVVQLRKPTPERDALIQRAFRLEWLTL